MTSAYPLSWPEGFPRSSKREKGQFRTEYAAALKNVRNSLVAFARDSGRAVDNPVLSTSIDPNPLATHRKDSIDPGVAVWFVWDGMQVCIAVDRYDSPAANLQAIHHIIEARRTELRHGTLHLVRASFQGFRALPAPSGKRSWWDVLELPRSANRKQVEEAYRAKARAAHPDAGGSNAAMAELSKARDEALTEAQ